MAKIKLDPMFNGLSGKYGGVIFRQRPDGTTIVSRAPAKSTKEPSPAQLAHQQRFKKAAAYAKKALEDPEIHAHYEEAARKMEITPYAAAMSDYLKSIPK